MEIKTPQEIAIMAKGGKKLASILQQAVKMVQPAMSKAALDQKIEAMINSCGAKPSFKNYKGYQHASCLSINEEVVHGIPNNRVIKEGDILGIDVGIFYQGFHTDAAITVAVGKISSESQQLIDITKKALDLAISLCRPGTKLGKIQKALENLVETNKKYSLVRQFSGHGIGKTLQEDPHIPNYYGRNSHLILPAGMVFCLEPMVILGKDYHVRIKADGWTAVSSSGQPAAHFEHTLAITSNGCQVLTKI